MSTVDKAKLRELAEGATPGPWMAASDWDRYAVMQHRSPHKRVVCSGNQNNAERWGYDHWSGCDRADADFIATANPATVLTLLDEIETLRKNAELYRALRAMHWHDSPLAVVRNPKVAIKPGHDCPSGDRLDEAIMEAAPGAAPLEQPTT
ncbi:MAG: ead/Ea22-like family protein [Halomonadaceae bacterium]|nr:ead/Ea22-like family protein [Halomonadaceae bacterium]